MNLEKVTKFEKAHNYRKMPQKWKIHELEKKNLKFENKLTNLEKTQISENSRIWEMFKKIQKFMNLKKFKK